MGKNNLKKKNTPVHDSTSKRGGVPLLLIGL